eukprot:Seg21027.1 transcript_id=Seg21027.1/GoldUCD/mRNA.D3Y31 product="hypothetical protein" protein_id=Seg21027.1/GoldUCD/D3Y31
MEVVTECQHYNTSRRKKTGSNGVARFWEQCDECGAQVLSIPKKTLNADEIENIPELDENIAKKFYDNRREIYNKMLEEAREEAQEKWNCCYNQYLATSEWKAKRDLVMDRAQDVCEGCRKSKATEVHHLTYQNVGEEFLFQLVALCKPCHDRYHA